MLAIRDHGDALVPPIQLGFLTLSPGSRIGRVFTDRKPHALRPLPPFQVIGAFLVRFLLAIGENQVRLDPAIGGEDYRAIPPSMRGLDSLGKIYFAVHR